MKQSHKIIIVVISWFGLNFHFLFILELLLNLFGVNEGRTSKYVILWFALFFFLYFLFLLLGLQ